MECTNADLFKEKAVAMSAGGRHPLTALFGRDETLASGNYAVYAIFEFPESREMKILKAVLPKGEELFYDSLTPVIPAAVWYERELHDMFGIVPKNHPDLRPLVLHENFPQGFYPLRKGAGTAPRVENGRKYDMAVAKGEGVFEVPVGPIHAGIIEPGHFRFSQAGEAMLQLDAKLFYTHRGLEKAMEGKTPEEAMPIVERICGACSVANSWSFCQAVEKLAKGRISRRAEIIRTLLMELERITNHTGDLGNIPAGVGFSPAISLGGRLKERLMRLQEMVAGNRFLRGMIVPGGVRMDITEKLAGEIASVLVETEQGIHDLAEMFAEQSNFQNRIRTTGTVSRRTAVDFSMVGVGGRASGLCKDSRKDFSYGVYDELEFSAVTEKTGDVAARILVRIRELEESFRMVKQLLEMLETEKSDCLQSLSYSAGEAWGISESARGSNFHYVAMDENGRIDRIFVRSASYPNWPALTVAVQGDIIPDFPLINKSFELCYACIDR